MERLPSAPRCRVLRVLVVEDNLDAVHMTCLLLRSLGHTAEYALNGYVALDVARRFKPDLVFLDIGLPGVDGFDVCRQIRRDAELMDTKIAMLTAYDTSRFRELAKEAGCDDYFVKPLDPRELGRLLGDLSPAKGA
jgi:DNA-binding response OmpR family regulator